MGLACHLFHPGVLLYMSGVLVYRFMGTVDILSDGHCMSRHSFAMPLRHTAHAQELTLCSC